MEVSTTEAATRKKRKRQCATHNRVDARRGNPKCELCYVTGASLAQQWRSQPSDPVQHDKQKSEEERRVGQCHRSQVEEPAAVVALAARQGCTWVHVGTQRLAAKRCSHKEAPKRQTKTERVGLLDVLERGSTVKKRSRKPSCEVTQALSTVSKRRGTG